MEIKLTLWYKLKAQQKWEEGGRSMSTVLCQNNPVKLNLRTDSKLSLIYCFSKQNCSFYIKKKYAVWNDFYNLTGL